MGVFAGAAAPLGRPVNSRFRAPSARGLWAAYCTSLVARPLLTKSTTSLAGFCLGDFIAQQATRRSNKAIAAEPYDIQRTMRLAFYGGCIAGPIGHNWFTVLDKVRLTHLSLPWNISASCCADASLIGTHVLIAFLLAPADGVSQCSHKVSDDQYAGGLLCWLVPPSAVAANCNLCCAYS